MHKEPKPRSPEPMAKAYEGGKTLTELSKKNRISVPEVRQRLVAAGVAIRQKGGLQPVNINERKQEMRRLYTDGKTLQDIGDRFGLTRERVRQILRDSGVESLGRREPKSVVAKLTAQEKKIAKRYDAGERPAVLLAEYNLAYAGLQNILKRANIETKPKGFFNRRPNYDKIRAGIIADYQKGVDTGVIAERYGLCGKTEIYKFIKREGIPARDRPPVRKRVRKTSEE